MLIGGILMVPWSEGENVKFNGDTYCYRESYHDIMFERRTCSTNVPTKLMIKTGLALVGSGALMTWLGYRKVNVVVTPQVSKDTVAATATVTW